MFARSSVGVKRNEVWVGFCGYRHSCGMKLLIGILFSCFALWFCEQTTYRFWGKYASRKNQLLTMCQLENNWFYDYCSWIPLDSWSLPPEFSSETEPRSYEEPETEYSKNALRYLRPFRDQLYDSFWSGSIGRADSTEKLSIPGGFLVRSSSVSKANSHIILTLTGPGGLSVGGSYNELSIESSSLLDHGVDYALATVNNFAEVLEVVGFLVGSDLDDARTVGVCAYGEQADLLALAMSHSPQLFTAVAFLSPMGSVPIDRFPKAEYPPSLFAARTSDAESIKSNALAWAVTCRRLSVSNRSRILGMIAPPMHKEIFSDLKLKTLAYAFLIDSLNRSSSY